ncbi:MAG TPA: DUF4261 domain-containing protein [Phycisphaerales bacterium]|nr:DUF4261 domain-containing protein [Phycisphaerales bacterium]
MLASLFRSKKPAPEPPPGPQLGMVCLKGELGLTPDRICRAWAKFFPALPPIFHKGTSPDAPKSPTPRGDSAVIELNVSGRAVMVAAMPMPIPGNDIPAACEVSWMWPDAAKHLAAHKAHAIILTTPDGDPVAEALDISRIAACVCAAGEGLGIYWGNGGHVHKPRFFLDALNAFDPAGDGEPPSMLWVGLRISGTPPVPGGSGIPGTPPVPGGSASAPCTLTTHGMTNFGHHELEIIDTHMPVGDLRLLAFSTTAYLLKRGPILKHNQTFGRTATEKFKVEHTTSRFRENEPVIRLHVP